MRTALLSVALCVAIGSALGCASARPAAAAEGLTVCNKDENGHFLVAMIVRHPILLQEVWESAGWFRIEPGQCQSWSRGPVNTLYLLSVVQQDGKGYRAMDFGVDALPDWHWDTEAYGMQDFLCVSNEAFGRQAQTRDAYRDCLPGEYLQLFNLHVFVEHNSDYTLNLK